MRASLCALAAVLPLGLGLPPADPGRQVAAKPDTNLSLPDSVRSLLSFVVDLCVAPDGSIYLTDRQLPFVLHLDRTGRLIRTVGRAGSGPGEFQRPAMLGWLGDSLWVYDLALVRLTLFDTVGGGYSTASLLHPERPVQTGGRPSLGGSRIPLAVLPDGELLVHRTPPPEEQGPTAGGAVILVNREFEVLDTVLHLPPGHSQMWFVFRDGARLIPQPFRDDPAVDASPDGRWLVRVDRPPASQAGAGVFTVTLLERGGRLAYRRELSYVPAPLPDDTVESFIREMLAFDAGPGHVRLPLTRDSLRRELFRPRFFPPVPEVRVGRDGIVWLHLVDAGARDLMRRGQAQWVALSPRGLELRRVTVPDRVRVLDVDGRSLWGVEYDPDGTPKDVRRYVAGG